MLELHIKSKEIQSSTIALSWCVDQKLIDELNKNTTLHARNKPHLLIIVKSLKFDESREERYLVPLTNLMTFINFKYPGENIIYATVVANSVSHSVKSLLEKRNGKWSSNLTDFYYNSNDDLTTYNSHVLYEHILLPDVKDFLVVDVPADVFAPEPSESVKQYVNFCFKNKAYDQCAFRKRKIFAYTIQSLLIMPTLFMLRVLACIIMFLFLVKNIQWLNIFKLISTDFEQLLPCNDYDDPQFESYMILKGKSLSSNHKHWRWVFFFFSPIWLLLSAILMVNVDGNLGIILSLFASGIPFLIMNFVFFCKSFGYQILTFVGGLLGATIAGTLGAFVFGCVKVFNKLFLRNNKWYLDYDLNNLECHVEKKLYTSVKDLPPKHRTVKLHFQELKAKVCKPFAG